MPLRDDPHALFVSPSVLRRHIAILRARGYDFVTFSGLAARAAGDEPGRCVALTFDDGFADNHSNLAPLLEAERIPATIFVVSGWLGRPHPDAPSASIMTAEQIAKVARAGIEIGAHTVTHPDLTRLDPAAAQEELRRSKVDLQDIIGAEVTAAAYPYGHATAGTIEAARGAGFTAACRASGEGSWNEPLNLPRQDMANEGSRLGLWLKRKDLYEPLLRTPVGRAARRLRRTALGALGR